LPLSAVNPASVDKCSLDVSGPHLNIGWYSKENTLIGLILRIATNHDLPYIGPCCCYGCVQHIYNGRRVIYVIICAW
jgi:hypothetical protein